jgi:anti-anti-sigma factor
MRSFGTISLAEPATHTLIIDLAAVTFIDSTGLAALVRLRNQAEQSNNQFVLTNVPYRVQRILELTALVTTFLIK